MEYNMHYKPVGQVFKESIRHTNNIVINKVVKQLEKTSRIYMTPELIENDQHFIGMTKNI